eukprot:GEMP01052668.1.p1 GENE.GEMP01052668.1~~GEMP01052668.1.p1  ORF type:complete len:110 (+),score=12.47 GEMP01052668.1:104-433(+)
MGDDANNYRAFSQLENRSLSDLYSDEWLKGYASTTVAESAPSSQHKARPVSSASSVPVVEEVADGYFPLQENTADRTEHQQRSALGYYLRPACLWRCFPFQKYQSSACP